MNRFRRQKRVEDDVAAQEAAVEDVAAAGDAGPAGEPGDDAGAAPAVERRGPWDEAEVDDGATRLDLGALQVPPRAGMELRLELEDATKRVVAASIGLRGSTVQLQAFAAPRTEGIWDDIRAEIAASVTQQGGTAEEVDGSFGRELLARLPSRTPDGRTSHRPVRFIGVDGPRWFVRAVFSGPAAAGEDAARDLEDVVRGVVVCRGSEAMAPRDLLPLKLPPQAAAASQQGAQAEQDPQAQPGPQQPGPQQQGTEPQSGPEPQSGLEPQPGPEEPQSRPGPAPTLET